MSSNQEIPNSNHNNSIRLDGGAAVCGAPLSDGALFFNGINNKSSSTTTTTIVNNSSNISRSAAPAHIELKSVDNGMITGEEVVGGVFGHLSNNNNGNNIINNKNNNNNISSTYPPSPPANDAHANASSARQLGAAAAAAAPAKPLTMANVSTLANAGASVAVAAAAGAVAVGGSPFSAISTSPTTDEDDESSDEEEGDSASEISFSSNSSVSSSMHVGNTAAVATVTSSNAANKDHQFLASVFGASYLDSFTKLGVQVVLPSNDVFPAELGLKGAAVLSAPQQGAKTLYLCPEDMEKLDSQTLVELLEIADEDLECSALVIALERKTKEDNETLAETLHALMYVGGAIVAPDAGVVKYDSEKYILVGLDL
ncbi:hypothetical protein P389DRAFT_209149 [Cystobasidium minutum MCA 4210]|uniref:uncharacterized protein n=1 Tax=Cystobasidium minutum MCA 4210 TaxID=1397322 RepID=UPI0034CD2173|eukprot:jgi/Rhomi1/209149/estExt_Genemark1.C_2_t20460